MVFLFLVCASANPNSQTVSHSFPKLPATLQRKWIALFVFVPDLAFRLESRAVTRIGRSRATGDILIWIGLALGAGIWLGIAARIAMRFIALQAGVVPGFSSGGSVEVILFGTMIGTPVALLVWVCRGKWRLPSWFGTMIGLVLFSLLTVFQPAAARSALGGTPDGPLSTTLLFAAAFLSYGAFLDGIWVWRRSRPAVIG